MSEFTVSVELKDCPIDSDPYARLDKLMEVEGFKRKVHEPPRFKPLNLMTHPQNMPHATYAGQSEEDSSTLRSRLESRFSQMFQCEVVVRAFDAASFPRVNPQAEF